MKTRRITAAAAMACTIIFGGTTGVCNAFPAVNMEANAATAADTVADFLNSGYNNRHVTIYDGTDTSSGLSMMGKTYYQGLNFVDGYSFTDAYDNHIAYISYNVEDIDSITFTLGHIDDAGGYDANLHVYLDNTLEYTIFCDNDMNTTMYRLDTSNVSSLRLYLDDTSTSKQRPSYFCMANIVLNDDFSAVPEGSYKDLSKINELGFFYEPTENNNELKIDPSASRYNGHSYKAIVDSSITTWKDAQAYCESLGGHLATISNAAEQNFALQLIENKEGADRFWLGGYYTRLTDTWAWVDGTSFSYTNWGDGAPDYYENNEFCLEMSARDYYGDGWNLLKGKWNDNSNDDAELHGFICEWDDVLDFILGDVNEDGAIDSSDASTILSYYAYTATGGTQEIEDFLGV